MRVLAIDPSMRQTGFCLPDGTTTIVGSASSGDDGMAGHRARLKRQRLVRDRALDLAASHDVELVVVEGYAYNQPNAAVPLGELGGLLRDGIDAAGLAWVIVPPNSRAKMATGKGNASKDMVLQHVAARIGRPFATSDECDAWVLWQMAQHAYQLADAWSFPQAHLASLTSVDWPTVGDHAPSVTYKPPPPKKAKRG